jgi:hypothetical protein
MGATSICVNGLKHGVSSKVSSRLHDECDQDEVDYQVESDWSRELFGRRGSTETTSSTKFNPHKSWMSGTYTQEGIKHILKQNQINCLYHGAKRTILFSPTAFSPMRTPLQVAQVLGLDDVLFRLVCAQIGGNFHVFQTYTEVFGGRKSSLWPTHLLRIHSFTS